MARRSADAEPIPWWIVERGNVTDLHELAFDQILSGKEGIDAT